MLQLPILTQVKRNSDSKKQREKSKQYIIKQSNEKKNKVCIKQNKYSINEADAITE